MRPKAAISSSFGHEKRRARPWVNCARWTLAVVGLIGFLCVYSHAIIRIMSKAVIATRMPLIFWRRDWGIVGMLRVCGYSVLMEVFLGVIFQKVFYKNAITREDLNRFNY